MNDRAQGSGYSQAAHAGHLAEHEWIKPPPGAGRVEVCAKCGARKVGSERNSACDGLQNESFEPTQHDYDPF